MDAERQRRQDTRKSVGEASQILLRDVLIKSAVAEFTGVLLALALAGSGMLTTALVGLARTTSATSAPPASMPVASAQVLTPEPKRVAGYA
jgi:hypothetical protein